MREENKLKIRQGNGDIAAFYWKKNRRKTWKDKYY
jgi:uncharacterized protein YhfF